MKWSNAIDAQVLAGRAPDDAAIAEVADSEAIRLGRSGARRRSGQLRADLVGLGVLEPLIDDERITDVLVNGDGAVWVDRGEGVALAEVEVGDAADVRRLATRLSAVAGRRLDDAQPWVDGLLPRGIRLHAVLPPIVMDGPHLSLRIPRHRGGGLDALVGLGMASAGQAAQLRELVADKRAYVITGGTGTGKTTLLSALLAEVPPAERVLVVEDVGEIQVPHPHVVRLQARSANTEGAGEVTMVDLVRQALRMRPDRLVVGEVRGAEVRDLLLALNTGHEGGCGTLHANRAADVPSRFEALGALAGMSREAVRTQVASAIEVVVHLRREGGRRVVDSISPLTSGMS